MTRAHFALIALFLCATWRAAAEDSLLSFTPDGWLVTCNPRTGGITQFHLQIPNVYFNALAYDPQDNLLYAIATSQYYADLWVIDPVSLAPKFIAHTVTPPSVNAMAWDPSSHTLLVTVPLQYPQTGTQLYRVNPQTGVAALITTYTQFMLNGLSLDTVSGNIYGITTASLSSSTSTLVRVDAATGAVTSLCTISGSGFNIAVIPGTTSFYVSSNSFERVDGTSQTTLGNAQWGQGPAGPFVFQNFNISPETVPVSGLTYFARDLCFPRTCVATVLNDNGAIAGQQYASLFAPFVLYPNNPVIILNLPSFVSVNHMNNAGSVVGSDNNFNLYNHAFLYSPNGQTYDLDTILGWKSGEADYINNHGDIAANGSVSGFTEKQPVRGLEFSTIYGIADDETLYGVYQGPGTAVTASGSVVPLPFAPEVFNNTGQSLGYAVKGSGGPAGLLIYTIGKGLRAVPSTSAFLIPQGLNDSGLALFRTGGPDAVIYDSSGTISEIANTVVPLHRLVPAGFEWTNFIATAVNNRGQILVQATSNIDGRVTSVLLTPSLASPAASAARSAKTICGGATLNGVPLACDQHHVGRTAAKVPAR